MRRSSKETMNSPKGKNFTAILISLAAILSPAAYLLGHSYYSGYLETFGLSTEYFPLSVSDIYLQAYFGVGRILLNTAGSAVKWVDQLFSPPTIYWIGFGFTGTIYAIYLLLKMANQLPHPMVTRIRGWMNRKLETLRNNKDIAKAIGIVGIPSYIVVLIPAILAILAILWWIFPLIAYTTGTSMATEQLNEFIEKDCQSNMKSKWSRCMTVSDEHGTVLHEGLLIAKNEKEIALLKKDGSHVIKIHDNYLLHHQRR